VTDVFHRLLRVLLFLPECKIDIFESSDSIIATNTVLRVTLATERIFKVDGVDHSIFLNDGRLISGDVCAQII